MRVNIVIELNLETKTHTTDRAIALSAAVIAGWTGRDAGAMEKHIAELEAVGVKRPKATPTFYRASASRITTHDSIEVPGEQSSGEVEFVLLQHDGRLWVGSGSDHTEREVETYNVTVSKQMCDKPVARVFWPYLEVADHWDELLLRSSVVVDGKREIYQEGGVSAMLEPMDLVGRFASGADSLPDGMVMFGGTLAAKGGVRPAERFEFELEDPVLGRTIRHGYDIVVLPNEG